MSKQGQQTMKNFKISVASDYGFYGKTGEYDARTLPGIKPDKDGNYPVIHCEYDDTPGMRDTTYNIMSLDQSVFTYALGNIDRAIDCWNALVDERYFKSRIEESRRAFSEALGLYRGSLMGESHKSVAKYAVKWVLQDIEMAGIKP